MSVTKKYREENATVHVGGKAKFPIKDKKHAISAERLKGKAKPPLTGEQKHDVDVRAAKYGEGPLAAKNKKKAPAKKAK